MELGRPDREKFPQDPPRRAVAAAQGQNHQPPPPQKCPRCDSSNTKFCYYNNYSLSQPRYFCKGCRRYWTHGGTLRNVPVGGGCRKSKRPKQQGGPSSSSSGGDVARRTQPLVSQNLTAGMGSSHHQSLIRGLPPVMPSIGNSLFPGGGVLSSLGAIQSLPAGIMSQAPPSMNYAGGVGQFGVNMALLQGLNLPPQLKPQAPPPQFTPPQNEFFPGQQSFSFPARQLNPWTHSFVNRDQASTSASTPSFWSGGGGDNQASSSFAPNQWSDKTPGFDPSE